MARLVEERLASVATLREAVQQRALHQEAHQEAHQERSWSPHGLLTWLLREPAAFESLQESSRWALEATHSVKRQLQGWAELSPERQASVSELLSALEAQGLSLSSPPAWLMSVEGCEAQAELYRDFLATYQELSPLSVHKG